MKKRNILQTKYVEMYIIKIYFLTKKWLLKVLKWKQKLLFLWRNLIFLQSKLIRIYILIHYNFIRWQKWSKSNR